MDTTKPIKIIPFCRKNGHKLDALGHFCVYCDRSKANIETNTKYVNWIKSSFQEAGKKVLEELK